MKKSRDWATFLRIPSAATSDTVPALSQAWYQAKGVGPEAETVLRLLKTEVLPLVRWLQKHHGLLHYHFLVHDWQSGVPIKAEEDRGPYIHLRLFFKRALKTFPRSHPGVSWVMTRPNPGELEKKIAGVESSIVSDMATARHLIDLQSEWVLTFVEAHDWGERHAEMIQQARQYLHFFSNMLQMQVQ